MSRFVFQGVDCDTEWLQQLELSTGMFMLGMAREAIQPGVDGGVVLETQQPFCGCTVCIVRETIAFILPKVVAATSNGSIRVNA